MKLSFSIFFVLVFFLSFSQRNVKDYIISTPLIGVHYGGNWAAGDLATRYGFANHLGVSANYKTAKNWCFGFEGNFLFGDNLKLTGLFDHLVDASGNITDINGDIGRILVYERGFNVNASIGKIFPVLSPNNNSGILINGGIGYGLHKMSIETSDQVIPQLELDYKKGYDRLTSGINFHQFIGYSFLRNAGALNFYAGFYIQEGLTKNRRTIFFDKPTEVVSKKQMLDIQYGFRIGWYIPFYKRQPKEYYYN